MKYRPFFAALGAGAWIMFSPYEPAFLLYAAGYLILGLISMGITCLITGKK